MPKILSVSYNPALLATRAMILNLSGYEVVSAEGFTEAVEHCRTDDYDLLIMGHSIPQKDKQAIIAEARKKRDGVPVLALLRANEPKLSEASQSMEASEGPESLLRCVRNLLPNK